MNLPDELENLEPFDRGKSPPDSSQPHPGQVWHDPKIQGWAKAVDSRLASAGPQNDMQKETHPKTTNGLPPEARTPKLRRTLLLAGMFALLAMIYVPAPRQPYSPAHYRFIFSQHETGIAFFQLLVNVAFAATVGALAANIPKRVFIWFRRCFLSKRAVIVYFIAIVIAGLVWLQAKQQAKQAEEARQQAIQETERVRRAEQAKEENERAEQEAAEQAKRAEIAKENAKRGANNQALAEKAFSERKLTVAQDYYRAAAGCWHLANHYDLEAECMLAANRIEKLKSEGAIDLSASLPDQQANQYIRTDPNAQLKDADSRQQWGVRKRNVTKRFVTRHKSGRT